MRLYVVLRRTPSLPSGWLHQKFTCCGFHPPASLFPQTQTQKATVESPHWITFSPLIFRCQLFLTDHSDFSWVQLRGSGRILFACRLSPVGALGVRVRHLNFCSSLLIFGQILKCPSNSNPSCPLLSSITPTCASSHNERVMPPKSSEANPVSWQRDKFLVGDCSANIPSEFYLILHFTEPVITLLLYASILFQLECMSVNV